MGWHLAVHWGLYMYFGIRVKWVNPNSIYFFLGLEKPNPYCSWSCLTGQIRCWWGQIFYPLLPSTIRSDPDSEEKNIRRTKPRRERTKGLTCHCIKNKERKPSLALLSYPPRTRQNSLAEMTEVKFLSLSLSFFPLFFLFVLCFESNLIREREREI